jgi:hypothetical protein
MKRKNIGTLGRVEHELSDKEMPRHWGLSYSRKSAKCLVGPDRPWSPQSIMEDRNSTCVQSGLDPHSTLNMDGVQVQNGVRHGGVSFGVGSTQKVEARGEDLSQS